MPSSSSLRNKSASSDDLNDASILQAGPRQPLQPLVWSQYNATTGQLLARHLQQVSPNNIHAELSVSAMPGEAFPRRAFSQIAAADTGMWLCSALHRSSMDRWRQVGRRDVHLMGAICCLNHQPSRIERVCACECMCVWAQVRAGRCGVQVVGGQLLPGDPDHLLLLLAASAFSQLSAALQLHIFSCHVISLLSYQAVV